MPSPGCSCTCCRSPRPGWPWWCSSHPPAGCTAAATESSSSTPPTPSVCVSGRRIEGSSRRRKRRRRCWSRRPNRSWSPCPRCPETTVTYTPRTDNRRAEKVVMIKLKPYRTSWSHLSISKQCYTNFILSRSVHQNMKASLWMVKYSCVKSVTVTLLMPQWGHLGYFSMGLYLFF